jgi:hypothetical protein
MKPAAETQRDFSRLSFALYQNIMVARAAIGFKSLI